MKNYRLPSSHSNIQKNIIHDYTPNTTPNSFSPPYISHGISHINISKSYNDHTHGLGISPIEHLVNTSIHEDDIPMFELDDIPPFDVSNGHDELFEFIQECLNPPVLNCVTHPQTLHSQIIQFESNNDMSYIDTLLDKLSANINF